MRTHSSAAIARYLLRKAAEARNSFTPLQLMKLVYLCHGWMLGLYQRPLVREPVEAWRYGPVIRDLYHRIRDYRYQPVGTVTLPRDAGTEDEVFDEFEESVMSQVVELYGSMSGIALSQLTHQNGTPWKTTWDLAGQDAIISNDLIEEHFRQLYERSNAG